MHERYRRQTDGRRAIAYSEREREFTFANKLYCTEEEEEEEVSISALQLAAAGWRALPVLVARQHYSTGLPVIYTLPLPFHNGRLQEVHNLMRQ